jgi:hypothetical protein
MTWPGLGPAQGRGQRRDGARAPEVVGGTLLFRISGREAEPIDLPRLVTPRGCAYVFLPSTTGIRYLAGP